MPDISRHSGNPSRAVCGTVIGELSLLRSLDEASRAGFGTIMGLAIGVTGKLAIGIAMIGVFLLIRLL